MPDTYATYTREAENADGETVTRTAILQSDPLSRAKYERKGWTYDAPAANPAHIPANLDGEPLEDLDAEEVVKQAMDVALRKMSGTWTLEEAAKERVKIRGVMAEEGAFDYLSANLPEYEEKGVEDVPPAPAPLEGAPAGGSVSMTGDGAAGVTTDGAPVAPAPTPAP